MINSVWDKFDYIFETIHREIDILISEPWYCNNKNAGILNVTVEYLLFLMDFEENLWYIKCVKICINHSPNLDRC